MASSSSLSRSFLSPTELALENIASRLRRYLYHKKPSDSIWNDSAIKLLEVILQQIRTKLIRSSNDQLQGLRVTSLPSELREVLYELEDLADELEYLELPRKAEETNMPEAAATSLFRQDHNPHSQPRKSKETSNMPEAATSLSRGRKRPQDDVMIEQIRQITNGLNRINTDLNDAIGNVKDFNVGKQQPAVIPNKLVTSPFVSEKKIFGREKEREKLTKMLTELSVSGQISILPVLGTGGVGKTTLVQCIFFDDIGDVAKHFNEKAWINLSGTFDRVRIIREIVESISKFRGKKFPCNSSLEVLQRQLEARLAGKKLFLVLDDVWSREWKELLLFLESSAVECVKIVVIARDPKVLDGMGKRHETILKGLKEDDCWSLLMNYAFRGEDPHNYQSVSASIGRLIVTKLKGSPLAAKAVGRMLGQNLSEEHWMDVLDSNLWDLDIDDPDDIMSALTLCYNHLSPHLQLCFVFCSVFPKDYEFDVTELIYMWTAHGYVPQVENNSETAEELGLECFHQLWDMSFIEYHRSYLHSSRHFRIHDLLHDLAHFVSSNEYYIYEGQSRRRIPETVHHLCVRSPIELSMVCGIKNLRTLVLYKAELGILVLEALKRVRVLILVDYDVKEFPDAVRGLKHLRYLDLYRTSIKSAPESLDELIHLRVLRLPYKDLFPHSSSKCTSSLEFARVKWKFLPSSSRRYEQEFIVDEDSDSSLAVQLRNMKDQLRGNVTIRALENVKNKEEVRKLELKNRNKVESLRLFWSNSGESCDSEAAMEVLEGLQPHPQLKYLYIDGYMGAQFPSWLSTLELQNLREIKLSSCKNLSLLPPIGQLPLLKSLFLSGMDNVTIVLSDKIMPVMFPSLKKLELEEASVSFEMSSSEATIFFPRLRYLRISKCNRLSGFPWPMLSSLKRLRISSSPGLSDHFPQCLLGLTSLKHLDITQNLI